MNDKHLGVAVVGTGWVSTEHIRAFERNSHTRVIALCSRAKSRARSKAESMGLTQCAAYDDYDAMLRDPEVDYLHGIGPWYVQYEWNRRKAMGGSSLLTAGCHAVDGLRWFLQKEAVEVFAMANFSRSNPLRYEYEPNSVTLIRFADQTIGKVASSIECAMPYVYDIELVGEQGTIRNNQIFSRNWPGQTGWATIPTVLPDSGDVAHHPFFGEIDHLVDCIRSDTESHVNVSDAVKTHEICLASEISAATRKPVPLPLE